VTVIARGHRLEQLRDDGAIITADGGRAAIHVAGGLDESTPWVSAR
jgi:2-dehydropantoate 2-reductase